jgi:chorismate-pyruvate lyase
MSLPLTPDLRSLVTLFSRSIDDIGRFQEVTGDQLPLHFRRLLDHHEHMTVTLEAAYGGPVIVEVKRRLLNRTYYARKSVLRRQRGGEILQYCVVRLRCEFLDETVREDIEGEVIPLGRVLIHHNVLRRVQRFSLWQIMTGPDLRRTFGLDRPVVTYGRTAMIYCSNKPAVELLEILRPREEPAGASPSAAH